jgi:small subunit ribosomal protein S6
MNRTYEVMFIVRPDMVEEELDKLISNLEAAVTGGKGTVKSVDKMGKRRLAYVVRRFNDGFYILLTVEGTGEMVHELERRLRVTEPVIKFITVRVDESQKRLEKIKAIRATKVKRPPTPVEAPAAPATGTTGAEAPA